MRKRYSTIDEIPPFQVSTRLAARYENEDERVLHIKEQGRGLLAGDIERTGK